MTKQIMRSPDLSKVVRSILVYHRCLFCAMVGLLTVIMSSDLSEVDRNRSVMLVPHTCLRGISRQLYFYLFLI